MKPMSEPSPEVQTTKRLIIVSGGQTGVDRAALDWALAHAIEHAGWCPRGRLAADGPLPDRYRLQETESAGYRQRTKRNVEDSDGTLIFDLGTLDGGTWQTLKFAHSAKKPHLVVQLDGDGLAEQLRLAADWIGDCGLGRLNVAGPREEKRPGAYARTSMALKFINAAIATFQTPRD